MALQRTLQDLGIGSFSMSSLPESTAALHGEWGDSHSSVEGVGLRTLNPINPYNPKPSSLFYTGLIGARPTISARMIIPYKPYFRKILKPKTPKPSSRLERIQSADPAVSATTDLDPSTQRA